MIALITLICFFIAMWIYVWAFKIRHMNTQKKLRLLIPTVLCFSIAIISFYLGYNIFISPFIHEAFENTWFIFFWTGMITLTQAIYLILFNKIKPNIIKKVAFILIVALLYIIILSFFYMDLAWLPILNEPSVNHWNP